MPYALTAHGTDVANAERSPRIRAATAKADRPARARSSRSPRTSAPGWRQVAGPLGDRLHIVSAGVDTDAFSDGDAAVAASALGWESDGPRVVSVANYIERKNLPRLLEAFARARSAWGGGSLALVGDGPQQAELEALARRARHRRRACASSCGAPPAEVPRWLRACDVACLVSTVEGFGLAPIEALACGRPVVVSREVPSGVAVTEGVTGAVCDAARRRGHGRRARARRGAHARRGGARRGRAVCGLARGRPRRGRARGLRQSVG